MICIRRQILTAVKASNTQKNTALNLASGNYIECCLLYTSFRMYLAGGLGNNPGISIPYDKKVDPKEILYYIEAMVDLFVAEGDYTNRAKARTRYIPRRMGTVEFLKTCLLYTSRCV